MPDRQLIHARVIETSLLAKDIFKVRILPNVSPWHFSAGQYLRIHYGEHSACFSIASSPTEPAIELHIERKRESRSNNAVFAAINRRFIDVSLPYGDVTISALPDNQPLVLIVSQSAYAQARSLLSALAEQEACRPCHLLWSAQAGYLSHETDWLRRIQSNWPALKISLLERKGDAEYTAVQLWDCWQTQAEHPRAGCVVVGGSSALVNILAARFGSLASAGHLLSDIMPSPAPLVIPPAQAPLVSIPASAELGVRAHV